MLVHAKSAKSGSPEFHRVSKLQQAGTCASGMAPEVPSTPLASQREAEKLSETAWGGGAFVGTAHYDFLLQHP